MWAACKSVTWLYSWVAVPFRFMLKIHVNYGDSKNVYYNLKLEIIVKPKREVKIKNKKTRTLKRLE